MRHLFGGSTSDYAMERVGDQLLVRPGATGAVWDALTGGNQLTDLTDLAAGPIETVTADVDGAVSFYGPDGVTNCFIDFGYARRYAVAAVDLGNILQTHLAEQDQPGGWPSLGPDGQIAAAQLPAVMDWQIVTSHGAQGDGVTDDTAAIQTAINGCPVGGVVYFPAGVYQMSATLDLPPGVTLQGSHANLMVGPGMTDADFPCSLRAAPDFSGTSMIQIVGDDDGTHPAITGEQRLINLMLDGSQLTGTSIDGIFAKGNVQNVVLQNVCVRQMPNNGIVTAGNEDGKWPFSWRMHSVMIDSCHAHGFLLNLLTDLTMIDCQAIGCWSNGFYLSNLPNSLLTNCRAEWCGNHGILLTGSWGSGAGSGGATLTGCSTDRNGWDGVHIDSTGTGPLQIAGLMTRRDGRNGGAGGGGYAGLSVAGATMPVLASNVTCFPGTDDDGTQTSSPQYGMAITGAATLVQVDDAYLHAATQGLYSTSTGTLMIGANVSYATGPTATPTRVLSSTASATKGLVVTTPTGAVSYAIWRAPKACTVLAVRGYRQGGSGATVNAQKNALDLLAADLSLSTDTTWLSGPSVQNASMAVGDTLTVAVRSVAGTPAAVTVQVEVQGL